MSTEINDYVGLFQEYDSSDKIINNYRALAYDFLVCENCVNNFAELVIFLEKTTIFGISSRQLLGHNIMYRSPRIFITLKNNEIDSPDLISEF